MAIKIPILKLERKKSYTFDVSNAALATHPFKLTADSGTSEYTTGVSLSGTQGQAGATITFAVDSTAPANMNYYCGTHGLGMGNHIVIVDGGPWIDSENNLTLTYTSYKTYVGTGVVYGNTGEGNIFRLEQDIPPFNNAGTRAFVSGGSQSPAQYNSTTGSLNTSYLYTQYFDTTTPGNASNFGTLSAGYVNSYYSGSSNSFASYMAGNMSNGTRALIAGGYGYQATNDAIQYFTCATSSNTALFGTLSTAAYDKAGASDGTKALINGGNGGNTSQIDYVTIDTTGNAQDFGDFPGQRKSNAGFSDGVKCVWNSADGNDYEYVTAATLGNATSFGSTTVYRDRALTAHGNTTYGITFGGHGYTNSAWDEINLIEYVTIATPGNATDWGSTLAHNRDRAAGTGNADTAFVAGGSRDYSTYQDADVYSNTIYAMSMTTPGNNATDFGDLTVQHYGGTGNSGNAA